MKHRISRLILAGYFSGLGLGVPFWGRAQAQPATVNYFFQDQTITLQPRSDVVAVQLQQRRTRGNLTESSFNKLKRDIEGARVAPIPLRPLANQFAIIDVPTGRRGASSASVVRGLQARSQTVQSALPVLTRPGRNDTIVVPNQILITVKSGQPLNAVLDRYNLSLIRPLRFTQNRYIVRSRVAVGLEVLAIATQLSQAPELVSAVPNFVQTVFEPATPLNQADAKSEPFKLPSLADSQVDRGRLLPHQWHLDSRPRRGEDTPRTDIRGVEAWKRSRDGKGVVVAVIDSLIQWDHPDLQRSLYQPEAIENPLPNEAVGWDFVGDDPNTRMDVSERQWLTESFRNSFNLKDPQLLSTYPRGSVYRRRCRRRLALKEMAACLRRNIRRSVSAEFHGTWSAGVIAARPQTKTGVYGVAPKAKILPVRVLGLGGGTSGAALAEAIRYAAARKVDIINLSLGGYLPSAAVSEALADVHKANPNLVVVASAGNNRRSRVSYPAGDQEVIAVGATNVEGGRSVYSNYGKGLDVVAPGGDFSAGGGIVTTGGTGQSDFWDDVEFDPDWGGFAIDPRGQYAQVEGTSFAAPIVSGVMALMLSEDRKRRLTRPQLTEILFQASGYADLKPQAKQPNNRLHYGHGLVNAEQAVLQTRQALKRR